MLLGLIAARRTVAGKVLAKLGVDLDEARNAVMPRPIPKRSMVGKLLRLVGLMAAPDSPKPPPDMPDDSSEEK